MLLPLDTAKEPVLRDLVAAGGRVTVVGTVGGYLLRVTLGSATRTLVSARGHERVLATLDTAGGLARAIGASTFDVDITGFAPARIRKARPDRAEALRKTRTRPLQQSLV